MTFASPAWLLGLLLVPVIWYLHRSGPILRRLPVSSVDLWRGSQVTPSEAGAQRRPDPAWIRRAAAAAALSIALAGPQLPRASEHITLWVDDSLSMRTVESGETRLQRGLQQVASAVHAGAANDVEVRTLSRPWRSRSGLDAAVRRALTAEAGTRELQPPDAGHLDRTRSHWLLTDGADARINAWLETAGIARVVQVAASSRNVGVASLTVRPQPFDALQLAVQVQLVNGGTAREVRRVEIASDGKLLATREISLDAGATTTLAFDARLPSGTILARLLPGDALPEDDVASLSTSALEPVAVVGDAACPATLLRAIRAHPGLRMVDGGKAGLVVDCGGTLRVDEATPRVRFVEGATAKLDASTAAWAPASRRWGDRRPLRLPPSTRGTLDPPGAADRVLLQSGGTPTIIVRAASPRVVETSLDVSAAEFGGDEALPLLFGLLADAALDEPLLDRSASVGRGNDASRVASLRTLRASDVEGTRAPAAGTSFLLPLLVLVIALLAWDALMLGRRLARDRARPARVTS